MIDATGFPNVTHETLALLDAIRPPDGKDSSGHTDDLYEMVEPLHATIDAALERVRDVEKLLRKADGAENNAEGYVFFERVRQTCDALTRQARDAANAIRSLTDTAFQLDRYGREMFDSLASHDARKAAGAKRAGEFVTISKAELDHLKERADLSAKLASPLPTGE